MTMILKRRLVLALALVLAFTLTACGAQDKPKEMANQGGFAPRLDTGLDVSLNVAGHYSNFEALEDEFARFNQYYPNVKLTYTYLDNYNRIIGTALQGEEAPDIFFTYPWVFSGEVNADIVAAAEDLSDEKLGIDLGCIRAGILYKDAQGHVPYVPIYSSTYGMLVNEAIFEKEKISIPTTYEQLVSACEALQKAGYASPMMGYEGFLVYPLYFPYFCATVRHDEKALKALNALDEQAGEYARPALALAADFMGRGFVDIDACKALENDYEAVILRFFEGDVPMMLASGGTVSGTEKRESKSEAFSAHPFSYSFHPVPSTEEGGYFFETVSMGFAVNKNSKNLDMTNEFMRFLICTEELNRMARAKRMVTPCSDMSLDGIYASFGALDEKRVINAASLGLDDAPDTQMRLAGYKVSVGAMTVDEAVAAFGKLE